MQQNWTKRLILLPLFLILLVQGAAAAEGKKAKGPKATYKQASGEVVSVAQDSIVIKNKTKGTMTFAITKATDMVGSAPKTGEKATVKYLAEQDRNRATRIIVKAAKAKGGQQQTAVRPAETAKAN